MKNYPATINDLLNHPRWDSFIGSKLGSDLFISDPERAERILEYAESGSDGSTHAEHIEDWREFADMIFSSMSWDEREEIEPIHDAIIAEIDKCEAWHEKNGSLHRVIGD